MKEDPLEHNATYGVIVNKNVRRRTRRGPPPPSVASKPTVRAETTSKTASNPAEKVTTTPQPPVKKEETSRPSSAGSTTTTSTTTKQPSLKRDTSDIFKAFAKSKNAAAKPTPNFSRNGTDSSIGNSEDKDSNLPNTTDDEGESEEEALFLDTKTRVPSKKRASTGKAEREAKLRKMMDDSDEEMEDAQLIDPEQAGYGKGDQPKKDGKSQKTAILKQGTGQEDTSADEAQDVNWSDSESEQRPPGRKGKAGAEEEAEAEADPADNPSAPPRRRRGKRKVMKKKTMKDEEGYLVTREEPVWESFSEDEPAPRPAAKTKTQPAAGSQSQSQGKAGAKGGGAGGEKGKQKGGGADIMKFFGKK